MGVSSPDSVADAVVVGGGPNGLVAANLLADAGWEVLVLEAGDRVGGAVASDESVRAGWMHDTCSSFYPLAAASPHVRRLELEAHGLVWQHAPSVLGTPYDDGVWAILHRRPEDTAADFEAQHPGDGDTWIRMCRAWDRLGDGILDALLGPFPPVRAGLGVIGRLPGAGDPLLAWRLLGPARAVAERTFGGRAPRILLGGNAAHADLPLTGPGSALMGWVLLMTGQQLGFPVPRGGAGELARAMTARLLGRGGEIRVGTRVVSIEVRDGRAHGVRTADGQWIAARHAVVADVSAPALYGGLVSWQDLPARTRWGMRRFRWDPGTVKVDWALDGPIPWRAPPDRPPGTVHLAESMLGLGLAAEQLDSGLVPAEPLVVLGQMATADPSRAPAGAESAWAYTHVPQQVRGDAAAGAGREVAGTWDAADLEVMADRIERRILRHAPDFRDRIVARRVLGPRQLEALDANLVGGALNGGTARIGHQLVLRPVPGSVGPRTPVDGLYLGSASAHPGGGVHGAPGANAARVALAHAGVHRAGRH